MDELQVGGWWTFECYNEDGSLAWREKVKNGVTNSGINDLLNVHFGATTQRTTWFAGLIDNAGFASLASGDTIASHGGWTESTAYAESVRQTWTPGAASGQGVSGSTMTFSINASASINGAFLASNSTKGGTSGMLWATGSFASPQVMTSGQQLKVTYSCSGAGA